MRIELAKLILLGTRITYQATGDAGLYEIVYIQTYIMHDKSVDRSQRNTGIMHVDTGKIYLV